MYSQQNSPFTVMCDEMRAGICNKEQGKRRRRRGKKGHLLLSTIFFLQTLPREP